jgi:hypothetical protein
VSTVWIALLALAAPINPALQVNLTYHRGETALDCGDDETFRNSVRARLGFDPFRRDAVTRMDARIERRGQTLSASLNVRTPDEEPLERLFTSEGKDCSELFSALSLAVTLAIDPLAVGRAPVEAPVAPAAAIPVAPPSPLPPSTPVIPRFQLGVLGALGAQPAFTGGAQVGGGIGWGRYSLMVEARADLPSSITVAGGRARGSLLVGNVVPCLHIDVWSGCALVQAGVLRAEGNDFVDAQRVTLPQMSLGVRAAVAWPAKGPWAVHGHADFTAPLFRATLTVGGEPVWSTFPLNLAFGAGILLRME